MSSGNVSWLLNIFPCLHGKYLLNFIFWLFRIHIKCAFVIFQFVSFLYSCLFDNTFCCYTLSFLYWLIGLQNQRKHRNSMTADPGSHPVMMVMVAVVGVEEEETGLVDSSSLAFLLF